jgi:hypothetical protein
LIISKIKKSRSRNVCMFLEIFRSIQRISARRMDVDAFGELEKGGERMLFFITSLVERTTWIFELHDV